MRYFRSEDRSQDDHGNSSLWLIIYTDMISNLMIFFLMLYGLTWLNNDQKQIAAASFQEAFSGKKGLVETTIRNIEKGLEKEKSLETKVRSEFNNVEVSEERIKIILPSPVLFDSASAVLRESTKKTLHQVAEIIKTVPSRVVVEGHTDDLPIHSAEYGSNWELSCARAFSVVRFLTESEQVEPSQIAALGYGEFRPKVPNDSSENRATNRRIEINIIKNK